MELLYELSVRGLEGRRFDPIDEENGRARRRPARNALLNRYAEQQVLTSANLCRWVINVEDIKIKEQQGIGSYGMVYRARWRGIEVSVQCFTYQKLDENLMLELRAESGLLSELQHPHIVLFIGKVRFGVQLRREG